MSDNPSNVSTAAGNAAAGVGAMSAVGGIMDSVSDTFKRSGGSDIVKNVTDAIPQDTKDYLNGARTKIFNRDQLRSPTVFFGFGEEKPFYVERTPSLVIERLRHNLSFFYLNYILIAALLFLLTLVVSPTAIIGIGLLGFAWVAVMRATQSGSCEVSGISITQKQASLGMTIFSGFALFYLLQNVFWYALGSAGLLAGIHAIFRDASMHKDEEDKIEMTGDIAGTEDASFLNPTQTEVV